MSEKSLRYNEGKLKWSLVHFKSIEPMVRVLMFGAAKYSPNNWKKGLDRDEILESMQRHLAALIDGEENDKESKLHHIGHIMCNCMFYSFHYIKEAKQETEVTHTIIEKYLAKFPSELFLHPYPMNVCYPSTGERIKKTLFGIKFKDNSKDTTKINVGDIITISPSTDLENFLFEGNYLFSYSYGIVDDIQKDIIKLKLKQNQ